MKSLDLGDRKIGPAERVFIIAEMGVNHDGSLDRAMELVDAARNSGADAVKLQIFRATSLMNQGSRFAEYQKSRVNDASPIEMLRRYELDAAQAKTVVDAIRQAGMIPLATPFSPSDVRLLEDLDLSAIKIASPDLVNRVLLERASLAGKPLLISTGAATMEEVGQCAAWMRQWRTAIAFLHCVSSYPTPSDQVNLSWISELAQLGSPVGYSDHSTELLAGALSIAAGACIVEKHLTYDRAAQGPDHSSSADPAQFAEYVRMIRLAERLRGGGGKHVLPIEQDVRKVSRQSLVLARTLEIGETIDHRDLMVQRPGTGIPAAQIQVTVGRRVRQMVPAGTILQWDMLADAA